MALTREQYREVLIGRNLKDGMPRDLAEACADAVVAHVEESSWGFPVNLTL